MTTLPTHAEILDHTLRSLSRRHNGFSGNCARVAMVLDEILETGGDYVVVTGEHYEFADHVFVRWKGLLWDMDGAHTQDEAEATWCDNDESEMEDFPDPDGSVVERMADSNNVLAGGFNAGLFRKDLENRLTAAGFTSTDESVEHPMGPKPRRPII